MRVKEIMTTNVTSVNPNSSIQDAARIMRDLNVGSVPVVEGNKPVGIVTDRDITIRNVATAGNASTPVSQVMTNNIVYGTPDMTAEEAARLMAQKQIRRLPIVENGRLVGIVALGDLATQAKTDMEAARALSTISTPSEPKTNL